MGVFRGKGGADTVQAIPKENITDAMLLEVRDLLLEWREQSELDREELTRLTRQFYQVKKDIDHAEERINEHVYTVQTVGAAVEADKASIRVLQQDAQQALSDGLAATSNARAAEKHAKRYRDEVNKHSKAKK